ncbi:MAG: WXG100 family type VII secretion target [Lachnospiraceae bacterium]|nr:WXG100 family type VII secretion target [Lachnospiraceae bacterium]
MAKTKVSPEEMGEVAKSLGETMSAWAQTVGETSKLVADMSTMWEGPANDTFVQSFAADVKKFEQLAAVMESYQQTIIKIANRYIEGEQAAVNIANR